MAQQLSNYAYNLAVGSATVCVFAGAYLLRRFVAGGACKSRAMLEGKTVIITGANTGVGKETAVDLARRKARVILACRSQERGEKAAVEVRRRSQNDDVHFRQLDLTSFSSIRKFAEQVARSEDRVDVLVNNAGVFMLPLQRSADGIEMHFAANYLGHFLLTNLLLPRLKESQSARIVNVAADIPSFQAAINFDDINFEHSYNRVKAVAQSKVSIILSTKHLARKLAGTSVTVNSVHPGYVRNEFGRYLDYWYGYFYVLFYPLLCLMLKTPVQGAQTSIYCAVAEELEGVSGKHFSDCREKVNPLPPSLDEKAEERLWEISEKMTGLS